MRTALVSDFHGNAVALETVAGDIAALGADQVVCLGDVLQGGPEPARTLTLLRELAWPVVLGNADAFLLDPGTAEGSSEPVTERQLAARAWSVAQLTPEDLDWIAGLPPTLERHLGEGRTLLACHGSPGSFDDLIFPHTPEPEFRALLDGVDADVVAGGHTHLQFVRRRGATLFVNPGSAGLSYDHEQPEDDFRIDPWAAYAVVTTGGGTFSVELRRIPLDVEAIVAAVRESRQPGAQEWVRRWAGARP
jgi:predicted phosphodiesterase